MSARQRGGGVIVHNESSEIGECSLNAGIHSNRFDCILSACFIYQSVQTNSNCSRWLGPGLYPCGWKYFILKSNIITINIGLILMVFALILFLFCFKTINSWHLRIGGVNCYALMNFAFCGGFWCNGRAMYFYVLGGWCKGGWKSFRPHLLSKIPLLGSDQLILW